jgi:hypothetical protein
MLDIRKKPPSVQTTATIIPFPEIRVSSCAVDGWTVLRKSHGWSFPNREIANQAALELAASCGEHARTAAGP